jgi:hypothetical protein
MSRVESLGTRNDALDRITARRKKILGFCRDPWSNPDHFMEIENLASPSAHPTLFPHSGEKDAKRDPILASWELFEDGALADLLPADGDPIANIGLVRGPRQKLRRDHDGGRLFKNAVP